MNRPRPLTSLDANTMPDDHSLEERVTALLQRRNVVFEAKPMMGGLCLMVDGKMCLGITRQRLMVRLDPEAYDAALQRPGCAPMDFTGRPLRGFVFVTGEGLRSAKSLAFWVDLALEFNPRATSSKRPVAPQPTPRNLRESPRNTAVPVAAEPQPVRPSLMANSAK